MADRGGDFSFFQDIHVKTEKKVDIFISRKSMIPKFGKQVHLGELTQMRLIMQVLKTSASQDHVAN